MMDEIEKEDGNVQFISMSAPEQEFEYEDTGSWFWNTIFKWFWLR